VVPCRRDEDRTRCDVLPVLGVSYGEFRSLVENRGKVVVAVWIGVLGDQDGSGQVGG
jgi:hypothetical protein